MPRRGACRVLTLLLLVLVCDCGLYTGIYFAVSGC